MKGYYVPYNVKVSKLFGSGCLFILNFKERNIALLIKQRQKFCHPGFGFFNGLQFFGKSVFQFSTDLGHG